MVNMMKRIAGLTAALFVGFAAFGAASAQDVIVVNVSQVFAQTEAGKDVQRQITEKVQEFASQLDIENMASELEGERTRLEQMAANVETGVVTQESFQEEALKARQKQQQFGQARTILQQSAQQATAIARAQFFQAIRPTLDELRQDKNALAVLRPEDAVIFSSDIDATSEAIARVNQALSELEITWPQPPEEGAAAE